MAYEQPGFLLGMFSADIDMSNEATWQFAPVWLGAAVNIVGLGAGGASLQAKGTNTNQALGVLQNSPVQGEPGTVVTEGVTKCISTGTIALGAPVKLVAGGAAAATTGDKIAGIALESAATGDIFSVYLNTLGTM